jgi:hypothetical protein
MKFKELKDIVNRLPSYLDDTDVLITKIEEDGFGNDFPLDRVLFGASVLLWSDYHPDLLENKDE